MSQVDIDVEIITPSEIVSGSLDTGVPQTDGNSPPSNSKNIEFKQRSDVWDHYDVIEIKEKGQMVTYAKCKFCPTKYVRNEKSKGSTGNMNTHLDRHFTADGRPKNQTSIISSFKIQAENSKPFVQETFRKKLVRWIVLNNQPYTEAESQPFLDMIKALRPEAYTYSNDTIRNDIIQAANDEQKRLKEKFENIQSKISFTHDVYTTPNGISFLGIGCHWISAEWELCNVLLDFVHLEEEHSGLNLCSSFLNSLETFSISNCKIMGVTMDNASNNDTFMSNLVRLCLDDGVILSSSRNRVRCFAHILNLSVQELLKSLHCSPPETETNFVEDEEHGTQLNSITSAQGLVKKIRKLVAKIHSSPKKKEQLKRFCEVHGVQSLNLMIDVKTRWNSTYAMLSRAETLKLPLFSLCSAEKDLHQLIIHDNDWVIIRGLTDILKKFEIATKLISMERKATISSFIPTYDWIEKSLQDFIDSNTGNLKVSAECALSKLQEYEPELESNIVPFLAAVLNPTLKLQYFKDHGWDAKTVKKIKSAVIAEFKNYYQVENLEADEGEENFDSSMESEFFKFLAKRPRVVEKQNEIENYLNRPPENAKTDVLVWWKAHESEFPRLSLMAKNYLATKASSVFMEREFSNGADLVTPTRSRLNSESISKIMCLRYWWKISSKTD